MGRINTLSEDERKILFHPIRTAQAAKSTGKGLQLWIIKKKPFKNGMFWRTQHPVKQWSTFSMWTQENLKSFILQMRNCMFLWWFVLLHLWERNFLLLEMKVKGMCWIWHSKKELTHAAHCSPSPAFCHHQPGGSGYPAPIGPSTLCPGEDTTAFTQYVSTQHTSLLARPLCPWSFSVISGSLPALSRTCLPETGSLQSCLCSLR